MNSTMATINNSIQQYVLSNFSLLDQRLADNITQQNQSIKQLQDSLAFVTSIVMNTVEQELWFSCQQQLYTFKIFDLTSITKTLTNSDFTSGFAFDTLVIQNALIEVQSIAVSFTLFKTQNTFLNIKIQLDDINYGTGSILSQDSSLQIKQVSFISKPGTQVTVNAGVVLSVLQQQAVITSIQNLLLNLTIESTSQGIITLIYQVTGKLTVKGYQILGSYQSTNTIALCATIVRSESNVSLNYINIQPQVFTCGNLSSFLISYVNSSILSLLHLSVSIGSSNSHNLISAITTTLTTYFAFGGFIAYQNSSTTSISDIQYNSYESWQTAFVLYSGQILGNLNSSLCQIQYICITINQTADYDSQFVMYGIIGFINGTLQVNDVISYITLQKGIYNNSGVIGYSAGISANIMNAMIQLFMSQNNGDCVGALSGQLCAIDSNIYNVTVQNSRVQSQYLVGLIAGVIKGGSVSKVITSSSYLNTTSNLGDSFSASVIALAYNHISIQQCNVFNMSIYSNSNKDWSLSSGLIGDYFIIQAIVQQIIVNNSIIQAAGQSNVVSAGGLSAWTFGGNIIMIDSCALYLNLSALSLTHAADCGGLIAYIVNQPATIKNSYATQIQIMVTGYQLYAGIIQGYFGATTFTTNQVYTDGINTINNVIITNCASVISQTQSGC
ncbi:Hypothetical_protein [Hexamita inflata]|uniref:Hypothetical_protein n=1 Tax=Hexamita inflata TaxID=28002 RepID=A0AA86R7B8_9EUKA|nr:Hypothetical protein HINF_LOCUS56231 [Hexamita inflata]